MLGSGLEGQSIYRYLCKCGTVGDLEEGDCG